MFINGGICAGPEVTRVGLTCDVRYIELRLLDVRTFTESLDRSFSARQDPPERRLLCLA
jgi:hypothetical protein